MRTDSVPAATEAPRTILVLDDNTRVPQWFRDHFGKIYSVIGVTTISAARDALQRHDIGVIVTSEVVGGESTVGLLRALRQQYPMLMAVMLTATQDSDLVARLINEVKVCRVLFRPVKTGAVDLALKAAMTLHAENRSDPTPGRRAGGVERGGEQGGPGRRLSLLERMRSRLGWPARRTRSTT